MSFSLPFNFPSSFHKSLKIFPLTRQPTFIWDSFFSFPSPGSFSLSKLCMVPAVGLGPAAWYRTHKHLQGEPQLPLYFIPIVFSLFCFLSTSILSLSHASLSSPIQPPISDLSTIFSYIYSLFHFIPLLSLQWKPSYFKNSLNTLYLKVLHFWFPH